MATVVLSFSPRSAGACSFSSSPTFRERIRAIRFAFIFLVALGIDYNIFLMARVREEALELPTRAAMLKGLAVTGGVITSAGIVLAGTFAVLAVLPLVALTQIGVTVAFGVLLDTFVVRSILVPALTFSLGRENVVALGARAAMIGSVWGLLVVGAVLASSVMVVLWYVQVRIRDASHVDVAWAVLIACAAILYAVLADGDVAHRVLAAVLASLWGFRLGGYLFFNRVLGKEEDGRYKALREKWGPNANRNLFWFFQFQAIFVVFFSLPFAYIALDRGSGFGVPRLDRDRGVGDREHWNDCLGSPARAVAREPGEQGKDCARRPLELVTPPELLLRVGELVRQRAGRDDGTDGAGSPGSSRPACSSSCSASPGSRRPKSRPLRSRVDYAEYQRTTSSVGPAPAGSRDAVTARGRIRACDAQQRSAP